MLGARIGVHCPETQGQVTILSDRHPIVDDLHLVRSIDRIILQTHIGRDGFRQDTVDPIDMNCLIITVRRLVHHLEIGQGTDLLLAEGRIRHIRGKQRRTVVQLQIESVIGCRLNRHQRVRDRQIIRVIIVIIQTRCQTHRQTHHAY